MRNRTIITASGIAVDVLRAQSIKLLLKDGEGF
jgi:hypothetical protein